MYTVFNYMTKDVADIDCEDTLAKTIDMMRNRNIGSLLIKRDGEVVGIFTERDLLNRVDLGAPDLESIKIKDVMTKDLKTVDCKEPYVKVIELMQKYNVRHMPVVKDAKIVGIVSLRDLLHSYQEHLEHLLAEREEQLHQKIKKIKESEEKFRTIFDNSAVAITLTDKNENIIAWNRFAQNLLGITDEELRNKPVKELYPDHEWQRIRSQNIRQLGMKHHLETRVLNSQGRLIDVDVSISMLKDIEGNITGSIGIMRDITERKLAEKQREVLLRNLEETNRELDDFTYIVSHDLKEPLRNIDAFSKFVQEDYSKDLDEEGKNYLSRIRANVGRMYNLIEDLLKLSRIERRKHPVEQVSVEDMIKEIKLRLEMAIKQKNAEIVIKGKLPSIFCDKTRFTEVFLNLISNSIKFVSDKPPHIEVGCAAKEFFYEFYVKDNGPGIEKRYHEKIFGIFQRLVARKDFEGTGAGLSIVKKIVQMHGGDVWVNSELGKGAIFYFTIPKEKEVIDGRKKLGEILLEKGLITPEKLDEALKEQKHMDDKALS